MTIMVNFRLSEGAFSPLAFSLLLVLDLGHWPHELSHVAIADPVRCACLVTGRQKPTPSPPGQLLGEPSTPR